MVLVAICKIPTKESINMAVLIGNNGTGKNVDSMKDEMSRMKEAMAVLDELIKGEERASVERDKKWLC